MGIQDKINFVGVEFDTGILRGQHVKYFTERSKPYGDPIYIADIYYAINQDINWQRFVGCKELMHLFDDDSVATKTQDELNDLIEKMAISPDLRIDPDHGLQVSTDKFAILEALCILFPKEARDQFYDPCNQGLLTSGDLARITEIPEKYIRLAMHENWDHVYESIVKIAR